MKRIYVAIALLILSVAMCTGEQLLVRNVHEGSVKIIDEALLALDEGRGDDAESCCKRLNEFWQKRYTLMSAMVDHACLEDTALSIREIRYISDDDKRLEEALTELKSQINEIRKDEKISFGNIF